MSFASQEVCIGEIYAQSLAHGPKPFTRGFMLKSGGGGEFFLVRTKLGRQTTFLFIPTFICLVKKPTKIVLQNLCFYTCTLKFTGEW